MPPTCLPLRGGPWLGPLAPWPDGQGMGSLPLPLAWSTPASKVDLPSPWGVRPMGCRSRWGVDGKEGERDVSSTPRACPLVRYPT